MVDFTKLVDMTEEKPQSNEYKPPAAGTALLRLVAYVELGKHQEAFQGVEKICEKVQLVFELHGKNYPLNDKGQPSRITVIETLSLHEKANFRKLFFDMKANRPEIKHMAQLVGEAFIGKIFHRSFIGKDGKNHTVANLRDASGYKIAPPVVEDPVTGEVRLVVVPKAISELKTFVWSQPSKEDWDALFIDGAYDDGNSKNTIQNKIMKALNFNGSKLSAITAGADNLFAGLVIEGYSDIQQSTYAPVQPSTVPNGVASRFNRRTVAQTPRAVIIDNPEESPFGD